MHPILNDYIRKLSSKSLADGWQPTRVEGDILITPDGFRWRIERAPTVADLVHIGDTVLTSYCTGGIVKHLTRIEHCSCPRRRVSGDLLCKPSWESPIDTSYHVPVITWSLTYIHPFAKQNRAGQFYDKSEQCYLNEYVAVGNRILSLFEDNDDEVFIIEPTTTVTKPMQFGFW